jgi:hypothetical protein
MSEATFSTFKKSFKSYYKHLEDNQDNTIIAKIYGIFSFF